MRACSSPWWVARALAIAIVVTRDLVHVVQVSICFLVGVKYEEQNMEVVPVSPSITGTKISDHSLVLSSTH